MGLRKTGSTKNEQHTWDSNFLKVLTDSKYVGESQLNSEGYEAVRKTVASIIYIQSVMMTFEKIALEHRLWLDTHRLFQGRCLNML